MPCRDMSSSMDWWTSGRARRMGSLESHVRYLQFIFRATRMLSGSHECWTRGRLRVPMMATRLLWRSAPLRRCRGGRNLAADAEFEEQASLARRMLAWYELYVTVLRRLESGDSPSVVHLFCGAGGDAEGRRRAGGTGIGVDASEQPDYVRRFGPDGFMQGDATSWAEAGKARDRVRAFGCMAGPPCQFYSTIRVNGEARSPPLIDGTRDLVASLFDYWSIENVPGARKHMQRPVELRGSDFGLRVDRPRLFESNFQIRVDDCVRRADDRLRARCCQGWRRRWRDLDAFGRPSGTSCCSGNTFALQGSFPWRCTLEECADAMGVDVGHMGYERLAQSIPPAYGELVFAQMCMARANSKFGVPSISFDDYLARPSESARILTRWLKGAGEAAPDIAVELSPAHHVDMDGDLMEAAAAAGGSEAADDVGVARVADTSHSEERLCLRELYYSHAGGFEQVQVLHGNMSAARGA